jgi:uncharacterized protein YcbX
VTESALHIVNEASVDDLRQKSGADFDFRVFRPNIVIDYPISFDEDNFNQMRVGNIMIR